VSGEQPEWKPAPSIFHTALFMVGARAEESIMVGDGLKTDVLGAIRAGLLASVWVRGAGVEELPRPEDPELQPTHTIASVLDLEPILAQL